MSPVLKFTIATIEYYAAIRSHKICLCIDTESIMLSEKNQRERDRHRMITLTCGIKKKNG